MPNNCSTLRVRDWLLSASLVAALATGCSHGGVEVKGDGDISFRYGNFCGKGWPILKSKTTTEQISELQSINPIDDLDKACRNHDVCYTIYSTHRAKCDDSLFEDVGIKKIDVPGSPYKKFEYRRFVDDNDRACSTVRSQIAHFAHANPFRPHLFSVIDVPASMTLNLVDAVVGQTLGGLLAITKGESISSSTVVKPGKICMFAR